MVHYFLTAPWWLRWVSRFAGTSKTWFLLPKILQFSRRWHLLCCVSFSFLFLHFAPTVILETPFVQSLSIFSFPPYVLHSNFFHPLLQLIILESRKDNMQPFLFQAVLVLTAQPICDFFYSCHAPNIFCRITLYFIASAKKERNITTMTTILQQNISTL